MADNFNVNRGIESKIKSTEHKPGAIWLTEDGQNLYLDSKLNNERIKITDIIDLTNLSDDEHPSYFPNKIYIDGIKLKKYNEQTGKLEIISDLESEVLESTNEFVYDDNDSTKATLADTSSPKKGTIVIDKNGDSGIVTSSTTTLVNVSVIANNKSKNVLSGYDIYFDSNHDGKQVGNIDYPFSTWDELYSKCENILKGTALTTIHLKSNSELKINNIPENIVNTIFTGHGTEVVSFISFASISGWNGVTFNKVRVSTFTNDTNLIGDAYIDFKNSENIRFKGCNLHTTGLSNCNNIYFDDCDEINGIKINESKNVYVDNCKIFENLHLISATDIIEITNSFINTISTDESTSIKSLDIINCTISSSININNIEEITLSGGKLIDGTACTISANKINLGTFDFNGVNTTFNGNVNDVSGLTSKQIYDKTITRKYGAPKNSTLEAHLDKIGETIGNLTDLLSETTGLMNAFVTKDTFIFQDDLIGNFRVGDVMTYVNESTDNLQFNHNLIGNDYDINMEYDYESINYKGSVNLYADLPTNAKENDVYSVTYNQDFTASGEHYIFINDAWSVLDKIEYRYYKFSLENALYFAKFNDTVNLISYSNFSEKYNLTINEDLYIRGKVYSVVDDTITVRIKLDDIVTQIKEDIVTVSNDTLNETQIETIATEIIRDYFSAIINNAIFEQIIKISFKDRLIRLSNGWDKLSGSTDSAAGNYHIVSTYGALSKIESDVTRKVGTLAYVEDEDKVYKWVIVDPVSGQKDWTEFSSGSGGSGSTITEMQYCDPAMSNDENYKFNYQTLKYPILYYNNQDSITLQCYVNTSQSGPITATLTCRPTNGSSEYQILTQLLIKRTNYIEIPKDKLFNGNAFYYLSIQDMYGYSFYLCDKEGNSLTDKLTYYISSDDFKLTTTFDDSLVYNFNKEIQMSYNLTLSENYSYTNLGIDVYDKTKTNKLIRLPINDDNNIPGGKVGIYKFIPADLLDDNGKQILKNDEYLLVLNADIYNSIENENIHLEVIKNLILMESNKIVINDLNVLSNEIYVNNFTSISYEFITTCDMDLYNMYYKFSENEITEIDDIKDWSRIGNIQPTSNRTIITNTIQTPGVVGEYYLAIVCKLETGIASNISNNIRINIQSVLKQSCTPITDALSLSFDTQNNVGTDSIWESKFINDTTTQSTGHIMKLYNTVNVTNANGWNNEEHDGSNPDKTYDLEPGNVLSSNGYQYLKLFGDSYGEILNEDGSKYSAFSNNVSDGFTVECCFRSNYPGNLDATVLKIDGKNGIEIKPDSVKGWYNGGGDSNTVEKSLVEDSWTHVVFTVNPQLTEDNVSNYNKLVPMKHAAIYINGVLAKVIGISTDDIAVNDSNQGEIIFNKNENVYGKTDIKVFRLYSKGFNAEEVLNNYHACIKDINVRDNEVTKNNINTSAALTEIYFIKNPNGSTNKDDTNNTTFSNINIITSKEASKTELVNSTLIIRRYNNNSYESYIDEVYTNVDIGLQGTSTLAYPNKNYRINLYKDNEKGKKNRVQFTNPIDNITWREEYRYTMKCDYMESSHMNNTGIARFINNKVYECADTVDEDIITGKRLTPVQRKYTDAINYNGYRNVIDGFPVMVFQTDGEDSNGVILEKDEYGNYIIDKSRFNVMGTYMFNLDKEAYDNLGFIEEDENGDLIYPYAQSIEVSTNFATSAGAFNSWTGDNENPDTRLPYVNQVEYYQDSMEARYQYEEENESGYELIDINNNEIYLGQKYILNNGEYEPISETDIINYDGDLYRPCYNENNVCYNTLARMMNFVDKSSDTVFKNYIHKHLNLSFAIDYYILAMIFGMVDNFGKNMMISTWNLNENGEHINPKYINPIYDANDYTPDAEGNILATNCVQWYPTFYDMDTSNGLNNYGEEKIDVNAEMPLDKLSGYIYKGTWDPASNNDSILQHVLKYNSADDAIILDNNGEIIDEYKNVCDDEYYLLREYVTHSNIADSTAYPDYYMYPRNLIRMLAVLTMNVNLPQDDTIIAMTKELDNLTIELKNNSIYKYYWQISINTRDAADNPIISAPIGSENYDGTNWLEFNCATYAVTKSNKDTERFRFYNTSNSRLWSRLGTLFQQEIYNRYNVLRQKKVLDVDTIINFLEEFSSGRIPKAYFNINSIFKYMKLGFEKFKTYGHMCNGDRRVTLRKWLTERFMFIDTVLYDPKSYLPTIASNMYESIDNKPAIQQKTELLIKTHSPCYITITRDQGANIQRKYVSNDVVTNSINGGLVVKKDGQLYEIETAQNSAIYIYGIRNISTINSLKNLLLKEIVELQPADKLLSVDLQNNSTITGLNAVNSDEYYFNTLNLSNCSNVKSLDLSKMIYLEELNLSGCTNLTNLILPIRGRLKTCILTNCNALKSLTCDNLFQLEKLGIQGCDSLSEISFIGCQKLTSLDLTGTKVSSCKVQSCNELTSLILTGRTIDNIIISGCKKLSTLDLSSNTFNNYVLKLNGMQSLTSLNVNGSIGLTKIILPDKDEDGNDWGSGFKTLDISGCDNLNEISYNNDKNNPGVFDFRLCTALTSLSVFNTTDVEVIKNLSYNNCKYQMFYNADKLTTLDNCHLSSTRASALQQFFRQTKISKFINCSFDFPNATSIGLTFYNCRELTKSVISEIINKNVCPKVMYADRVFANSTFANTDTNMDIAWFEDLPINDFSGLFFNSNVTSVSNDKLLTTRYTLANDKQKLGVNCTGVFKDCKKLETVSRDIIANNQNIKDTTAMFYGCTELKNVINIYKNIELTNTSYMFTGCKKLKATMNLMKKDIDALNNNEISAPSILDNSEYENFLYMSTYYLPNITECIEMYAGMIELEGSDIHIGDLESGYDESCIPNNYFANNKELKDISGMFRNCSKINCTLPDCFFDMNNTTNITTAMGTLAYTNVTGIVGEHFFKGAENITTLSGMTTSSGAVISNIINLKRNFGAYITLESQRKNLYADTWISPTNYSFFFATPIIGYHDKCLWPLTKLTNANYLFAKSKQLSEINTSKDLAFMGSTIITESEYENEDSRCCISSNTFIKNTELESVEGCFFGQLGLGGIPSHNLFKKNKKLSNVSSLFLGCYNLGSSTGRIAITGEGSPAKMIDFSECCITKYHAMFANCSKYVVSLLPDIDNDYYPMNNTFKANNNPNDISFIFNECPALIEFIDDDLTDSSLIYTQYAFNQAFTCSSNDELVTKNYEADSEDHFGITISNYNESFPADRVCHSTISGKIPKYLFKNKTSLCSAEAMFAGTAVNGWIPSTLFDIDDNYDMISKTDEYYYIDNKEYEDNHVFYYKDDEGKMVEYTSNITIDVQKYSKGFVTYDIKELKKQETVKTYFKNIYSLAYMFAYCSNLSHPGLVCNTYHGGDLYDTLDFNGYIKDENGDYVLDDYTYKFRRYNPETDNYNNTDNIYNENADIDITGNKQRYSQYNQCMLHDDAYNYNSINKSFSVNLSYVYFIHPNTLQFIVQDPSVRISMSGFTRDCINLQGVISEDMLTTMKNINSVSYMFYNCINLYGTTTNEINKILDNQLQYLNNMSHMFYNCISLNRLSSVKCELTEAKKNVNGYYNEGFISNRNNNNLGIFYPGQNTLNNIQRLFCNCENLIGTVKFDQFINSSKHKLLEHSINSVGGAFANCPKLIKVNIPNSSYMLSVTLN